MPTLRWEDGELITEPQRPPPKPLDRLPRIHVKGNIFVDDHDREITLRGVNVSGACKLPISNPSSPDDITFVGRPFTLDAAYAHWARLHDAGCRLVRLVVVWEAVEHEGRGVYDRSFLSYLRSVVESAGNAGLLVVIDIHQDCWSRYSGGSGAPAWTFHQAGIDITRLEDCGAALTNPADLWPTNYAKFAVNAMFTLFWTGEAGLMDAYLGMVGEVFGAVAGLENVVGFDAMNEPHPGWLGLQDMNKYDEGLYLHLGDMPSANQAIGLARGIPQTVPHYKRSWPWPTRIVGRTTITPERSLWLGDEPVFDLDRDFEDVYVAFLQRAIDRAREAVGRRSLLLFVEPVPHSNVAHIVARLRPANQDLLVAAPHWYDLKALFEKRWSPTVTFDVGALGKGSRKLWKHVYFGQAGCRRNYAKQYDRTAPAFMGVPVVIGETGVPFDAEPGDPTLMLDIMTSAMESRKLGWTLWNYTPENTGGADGDLWNREDLSLVTHGDKLRATDGWIKPYMIRCAGRILRSGNQGKHYVVRFDGVGGVSEMFVPSRRTLVIKLEGRSSTAVAVEGIVEIDLPPGLLDHDCTRCGGFYWLLSVLPFS
ncbi:hypothetical protein PYCC9005_005812 [Savitreella phatthalungensis]